MTERGLSEPGPHRRLAPFHGGGSLLAATLLLLLPGCSLVHRFFPETRAVSAFRACADSLGIPPERVGLTARIYAFAALHAAPGPPTPPRPDSLKVHPLLRQAILTRPNDVDTVLVSFRDPVTDRRAFVRHFTHGVFVKDSARVAVEDMIADSLKTGRASRYQGLADTLMRQYGATAVFPGRFRFGLGLVIQIPLNRVIPLAHDPRVLSIDPLRGEGPPAGGCIPLACPPGVCDVGYAKEILGATGFVAAGYGDNGRIAMLDTGVRQSHCLLGGIGTAGAGPGNSSPVVLLRDCVSGTCVPQPPPQSDVVSTGHGTSTAAILAGTQSLGQCNRGLTSARISSFQVYFPATQTTDTQLCEWGAWDAFDQAQTSGNDVIVAEIATGTSYGLLDDQAGWAYDMGAVVVAANGDGPFGGVPRPANSPFVIGVGAYNIKSLLFNLLTNSARTPDRRIKPDVGGPDNVLTAANGGHNDNLWHFPLTSGATPFVAATALLLRNWMASSGYVEPGYVYAMLILCGRGGTVDANKGAGLVCLPRGGVLWWGSEDVGSGDDLRLAFDPGHRGVGGFEAAIWWPEYGTEDGGFPASDERARISLEVRPPGGGSPSTSDTEGSVFEHVTHSRSSAPDAGAWRVDIRGLYVPQGTRTVYYATWAKP